MFTLRVHMCPGCRSENGADGGALAMTADVGAEVWGGCWSCGAEFRLDPLTRSASPTSEMVHSYRTPTVSPYAYPMWKPRSGAGGAAHR